MVATPLGNLEDITLRALRVLRDVHIIAAEDTRHSRKLLSHYGIGTSLVSYHAHNQEARTPDIISRLQAGQAVALVSDAGTPGISDPGTKLVDQVWEAGLTVVAIPGPAAATTAVSLAGFDGDITFIGFLPRRTGKRLALLDELAGEPRVLVLYESPRRLQDTLAELAARMPQRRICIARELTKMFEQCWRGPLPMVCQQLAGQEIRGECTLVLSRPEAPAAPSLDLESYLLQTAGQTQQQGRSLAEAVAADLGLPKRQVYQTYLRLKAAGRLV